MIFVVVGLRRALRLCAVGDEGLLGARACNPQVLAEQRFHNVIEEMAVAASLAPPRVLIRDGAGMNAVVLGADDARTSILTTTGLLTELSRQEMLGVAGHLVGSIANGDVTIGLRTSIVLSLFGLCARFADAFSDPGALRDLGKLTLAMVAPSRARSRKLAAAVADPFASRPAVEIAGWRRLAWMPLAGPVAITGFFAGLASFFALGPLLALAWRQRKYMADATAVRLTRDPDAIGGAIHKLGRQGFALVPWASHLAFAHASASRSSVIGASIVPMFPASSRRLRSLQRLGAHIDRLPSGMARRFWLIVTPLYAVVGVLAAFAMFMLVILSVGLTMLFLGLPFGVIHTVLRLLGH
jgi:Zn-dependent protease with chaperone function